MSVKRTAFRLTLCSGSWHRIVNLIMVATRKMSSVLRHST